MLKIKNPFIKNPSRWASFTYYVSQGSKYHLKTQDLVYDDTSDSFIIENTRIPANSIRTLVYYYSKESNYKLTYKELLDNCIGKLENTVKIATSKGKNTEVAEQAILFLNDLKNILL